jgi:hypothetical protein
MLGHPKLVPQGPCHHKKEVGEPVEVADQYGRHLLLHAKLYASAFGSSAESWLNHQLHYDLWQVQKQRKNLRVVKFAA